MNARKESAIHNLKNEDGKMQRHIVRKERLKKNERLNGLVTVLGLDYTLDYDLTPQGNTEFATLRYGSVIAIVA